MLSFLAAFDRLYEIAAISAAIVICGLTVGFGNPREKLAGLILFIDSFAVAVLSSVIDPSGTLHLVDTKSLLVLVAYAAMSFRWSDRWLIVLTGLQGFAVLLHYSAQFDGSISTWVNGFLLNATGWSMMLLLGSVTVLGILQRWDRPRSVT